MSEAELVDWATKISLNRSKVPIPSHEDLARALAILDMHEQLKIYRDSLHRGYEVTYGPAQHQDP